MLLKYFLKDFELVPVAPIITGITCVFTFHMRCVSIIRSLYFRIFSAYFFITFLSPGIATSISIHVPFSLSRIMMSGWGWFCRFALVASVIWLPCPLDLFLLIFVHVHTRVHCLILPLVPYTYWSAFEHTLYDVAWCIVLLPVLGTLT
jgi:hypothetical protein